MSRRVYRRNPDSGVIEFALYAAVGYGLYWLYQQFQSYFATGTGSVPITAAANFWANLTSGAPIQTTGTATLPNGTVIPTSALTITNMATNQATYQGQTYTLSEDASGNYVLN